MPWAKSTVDARMIDSQQMTDAAATNLLSDFRRYAGMIRSSLTGAAAFMPEAESATAVQVERGVVFPHALIDPRRTDLGASVNRLMELSTSDRLTSTAVVDRS